MIQNKSALDFLKSLDDKSVSLVFYDPPYNVGKNYDTYKDNLSQDDYEGWMIDLVQESIRVATRGVAIYISCELTKFFWNIVPDSYLIPVHKRAAGVCKKNVAIQYHSIITNVVPTKRTRNLWDDVRLPGEGYFFKEKRFNNPGMTGLALTEKVLDSFSLEGETVVDPFSGCGTTWLASKKMNRKFFGSEISTKYISIAEERIGELQLV
jgi:DNA modification methylase